MQIRTVIATTPYELEKFVNATVDVLEPSNGVVSVQTHYIEAERVYVAVLSYWSNAYGSGNALADCELRKELRLDEAESAAHMDHERAQSIDDVPY